MTIMLCFMQFGMQYVLDALNSRTDRLSGALCVCLSWSSRLWLNALALLLRYELDVVSYVFSTGQNIWYVEIDLCLRAELEVEKYSLITQTLTILLGVPATFQKFRYAQKSAGTLLRTGPLQALHWSECSRGRPIIGLADIKHFTDYRYRPFFFYANKHTIYRWHYLLVNK